MLVMFLVEGEIKLLITRTTRWELAQKNIFEPIFFFVYHWSLLYGNFNGKWWSAIVA
jgi:hypothetical protein